MKTQKQFEVTQNLQLSPSISLLKLRPVDGSSLPEMFPGQFVNILVKGNNIFLRRPISICYYDALENELWLMVKGLGKGSEILCKAEKSDVFDIILPLGNGFKLPTGNNKKILLTGGGVGAAPLYFLATWLKVLDIKFSVLLGARNKDELIFEEEFSRLAPVYLTTDDGSRGEKNIITGHSIMKNDWTNIFCCGPLPMMKSIARISHEKNIDCQVSLENHMACGIGACLCCVEDTVRGNECVCTKGPVFNINDLKW